MCLKLCEEIHVPRKTFSIIIPVLHEAAVINDLLAHLRQLEDAGQSEIIVVDGSPVRDTLQVIAGSSVLRLTSPPGRARQMNTGAARATGNILIFLHADTRLPANALPLIKRAMAASACWGGAFNLGFSSGEWVYRVIARIASLRSRLTRIPYGDQALFISRAAFRRLGGYPLIPIMEDVALMRLIKKEGGRITIIPQAVATSPRRWESEGIIFTTLRNWLLLASYLLGKSPEKLARYYRNHKRTSQ
jgi:rSAM/selenodomain-associated transferase 2